MGFTKEYHVFDTRTLEYFHCKREQAEAKLMPTQNEKVSCKQKKHAQLLLEFMDNPVAYYDYFTNLLDTSKAYITADFSPSYSALSITTLSEIKSEFSHRGIRVFPIFLMREPVDRLRSMVKMNFRNSGIVPDREQELEAMRKLCGTKADQLRSSYNFTYENLCTVFGETKFVSFYETLFHEPEIRRLCQQLELEYTQPDFAIKENPSPSAHIFSASDVDQMRTHYQAQYDFAEETFGKEFIDSIWKQSYLDNFKSHT